jgi:hypothetical protein
LEKLGREELITRVTQLQNAEFHAKAMSLLKTFVQDFSEGGRPGEELEDAYTASRNSDILFYDPDLDSLVSGWKDSLEREDSLYLLDFDRGQMTLLLIILKSQALQKAVREVFEITTLTDQPGRH